MSDISRSEAVRRLVSLGQMTHDEPGLYIEGAPGNIAKFDITAFLDKFPDVLQVDIESSHDGRFIVTVFSETTVENPDRFAVDVLPTTTDQLIRAITDFFSQKCNVAALDEVNDIFDSIG